MNNVFSKVNNASAYSNQFDRLYVDKKTQERVVLVQERSVLQDNLRSHWYPHNHLPAPDELSRWGCPYPKILNILKHAPKLTLIESPIPKPSLNDAPINNSQGYSYEGELKGGKPHGQGVLITPDGTLYKGEFKDGKLDGQGIISSPDGYRYEGELKYDRPHGLGVLTSSNGARYEGNFKDGQLIRRRGACNLL